MTKLSILIPAKNEKHLQRTVDDIFAHAHGDIEVLVGLDGVHQELTKREGLIVRYQKDAVGQRAMTNILAGLATGHYVMKVDAHCTFSPGFDVNMKKDMDDTTIMAPALLSLDEETWQPIHKPVSSQYAFDTDLVFQHLPEAQNAPLLRETMCLQGSAWMVSKKAYFEWNLCDESLGSWGSQGVELGIKAFINGGRCVTTLKAYYGHLFRENETDFPYKRNKRAIKKTHTVFKERFKNKKIADLIRKYNYPCNWSEKKVLALK